MLFIPEEQVEIALKELREKDRKERREISLKFRQEYLKAKEEGKLDEYYEKLSRETEDF